MAKILKNTTLSDIEVAALGLTIPASGQITIEEQDYLLLANTDSVAELTTLINSGDVVVNDGTADLVASEGISYIKYPNFAASIRYTPTTFVTEDNVQDAIGTGINTAIQTPRYTIPLLYNGTVGNNEFIGYTNLLPGDSTPIIIPVKSSLQEYTFSNGNSNADYTIELRKNSTTATVFNTVSKTNTQFFVESSIGESFLAGDEIYIKYLDNGNNANDVAIILTFRVDP